MKLYVREKSYFELKYIIFEKNIFFCGFLVELVLRECCFFLLRNKGENYILKYIEF